MDCTTSLRYRVLEEVGLQNYNGKLDCKQHSCRPQGFGDLFIIMLRVTMLTWTFAYAYCLFAYMLMLTWTFAYFLPCLHGHLDSSSRPDFAGKVGANE